MLPQHFTQMAEAIEKQIAGQSRRTIRRASKTFKRAHLAFDTSKALITVVNAADAVVLATMPLLELLSFRVLRGQSTTYTEALLFVKQTGGEALVAHRIVFESNANITNFHATLKTEFAVVSAAMAAAPRETSQEADSGTLTIVQGSATAQKTASAASANADGGDTEQPPRRSGGRRSFFFNLDSDDGELIISDTPSRGMLQSRMAHSMGSHASSEVSETNSAATSSTVKTLDSGSDATAEDIDC